MIYKVTTLILFLCLIVQGWYYRNDKPIQIDLEPLKDKVEYIHTKRVNERIRSRINKLYANYEFIDKDSYYCRCGRIRRSIDFCHDRH